MAKGFSKLYTRVVVRTVRVGSKALKVHSCVDFNCFYLLQI